MRKILLSLASFGAIVVPIAVAVSCGSNKDAKTTPQTKTDVDSQSTEVPQHPDGIGNHEITHTPYPSRFTIPPSVTSIENGAFQGETLPQGFKIPPSVTSIGDNAFYDATLPLGFTIPSSVTSIGNNAFYGAHLPPGFIIPSTVKTIGEGAFPHEILQAWRSRQNT